MWLNNHRQTVDQWELQQGDSRCPLCNRLLTPKRGDWISWHWAHRREQTGHASCPWEESAWHLRWKLVYHEIPGWQIEYAWRAARQRFILDACKPGEGYAVEFVHSLSDYYLAKHIALKASGLKVQWIWDGSLWASQRAKRTHQGDGRRRFMKARPFEIFQKLGGHVHWNGTLWHHWKANVWFPLDTANARKALAAFDGKTKQPNVPNDDIPI